MAGEHLAFRGCRWDVPTSIEVRVAVDTMATLRDCSGAKSADVILDE